jgi:hypothetical protein
VPGEAINASCTETKDVVVYDCHSWENEDHPKNDEKSMMPKRRYSCS